MFNCPCCSSDESKNNRYHSFIADKRVAIVGPAETVLGTKARKLIDSYDVVVRLNNVFEKLPFPSELAEDIGNRTSVIYMCPADFVRITKECLQRLEIYGVKFIVTWSYFNSPYYDDFRYNPADVGEDLRISVVEQHIGDMFQDSSIYCVLVDCEFFEHVWDTVDANPKCGFLTIMHILAHPISELYVTGMTFMHGGGHLFRNYKVITPGLNHKGELTTSAPENELGIFRSMYRSNDYSIHVDDALLRLLEK